MWSRPNPQEHAGRFDPAWRAVEAAEEVRPVCSTIDLWQDNWPLGWLILTGPYGMTFATIYGVSTSELARHGWSPMALNRTNTRLQGLLIRMDRLKSPQGIARLGGAEINAHRRTVDTRREGRLSPGQPLGERRTPA